MKRIALFAFLSLFISYTQAQDTVHLKREAQSSRVYTDRQPQAVFAEAGGNGIVLSMNYDRRFSKRTTGLGFRAGIGYSFSYDPGLFTIPVGINYLMGRRNSFFELGIGETPLIVHSVSAYGGISVGGKDLSDNEVVFMTTLNVGYRLQPVKGGFNLRAGFMPLFIKGTSTVLPYLSLGYNF